MDIPTFPAGTPAAKVNAAFDEAGCVVVTGLLEDDTRTAIRSDLAPHMACLLYTSPSPRDKRQSRMPSSA